MWRMRRSHPWLPLAIAAGAIAFAGCAADTEPEVLGVTVTAPDAAVAAAPEPTAPRAAVAPRDPTTTTAPPTTSTAATTPPSIDLAAATEARISYPFREVLDGWTVAFEDDHDGVRGLTFPDERRIEIYVDDGDGPADLARVLAHEVGHALDIEVNDDADRAAWRAARGIPETTPWWPTGTVFDFDTGSGDWAEAFAVWQTGATNQSTAAAPLTDEHLALLASLLP